MSGIDKIAEQKLGSIIRLHRGVKGYTIRYVAKLLGISPQQMQKYEFGIDRISATRLHILAKFLETPLHLFFEEYHTSNEIIFADQAYALIRDYKAINNQAVQNAIASFIENLADIYLEKSHDH